MITLSNTDLTAMIFTEEVLLKIFLDLGRLDLDNSDTRLDVKTRTLDYLIR
jgi:hypothetical protein